MRKLYPSFTAKIAVKLKEEMRYPIWYEWLFPIGYMPR